MRFFCLLVGCMNTVPTRFLVLFGYLPTFTVRKMEGGREGGREERKDGRGEERRGWRLEIEGMGGWVDGCIYCCTYLRSHWYSRMADLKVPPCAPEDKAGRQADSDCDLEDD